MYILEAQCDTGRENQHQNEPFEARRVHNATNELPYIPPFLPHLRLNTILYAGTSETENCVKKTHTPPKCPLTSCRYARGNSPVALSPTCSFRSRETRPNRRYTAPSSSAALRPSIRPRTKPASATACSDPVHAARRPSPTPSDRCRPCGLQKDDQKITKSIYFAHRAPLLSFVELTPDDVRCFNLKSVFFVTLLPSESRSLTS